MKFLYLNYKIIFGVLSYYLENNFYILMVGYDSDVIRENEISYIIRVLLINIRLMFGIKFYL